MGPSEGDVSRCCSCCRSLSALQLLPLPLTATAAHAPPAIPSSPRRALIDVVSYRKGKIEASVLLHPRCTDQANFVQALKSLEKETDRQDILEMVGASIKKKMKKEIKSAHQVSGILGSMSKSAAETAAAKAAGAPGAAPDAAAAPPPPAS